MKSFRIPSNWNGDGLKLFRLQRFLEKRGFDLREGYVEIKVCDDGNWDFFNLPKVEPPIEKEEVKTIDPEKPLIEAENKPSIDSVRKREIPTCKKCGTEHWPMHKCPRKEN